MGLSVLVQQPVKMNISKDSSVIAVSHFQKYVCLRDSELAFFLVERRYLAATLHSCLHILFQFTEKPPDLK